MALDDNAEERLPHGWSCEQSARSPHFVQTEKQPELKTPGQPSTAWLCGQETDRKELEYQCKEGWEVACEWKLASGRSVKNFGSYANNTAQYPTMEKARDTEEDSPAYSTGPPRTG